MFYSPSLSRVSYTVNSRSALDEALAAMMTLKELRQLELVVKNFTLCPDQLRVIGESLTLAGHQAAASSVF